MKVVCPKNKRHKLFVTTAHVMEEWLVGRDGNFIDSLGCLEVTHAPDPGNTWTCRACGTEAKVTP